MSKESKGVWLIIAVILVIYGSTLLSKSVNLISTSYLDEIGSGIAGLMAALVKK